MDEVLIGEVTDSQGMKSTLLRAYKVAANLDTTAPQVQITSPAPSFGLDAAYLEYTAPGQLAINVAGLVTENIALASVVVNGITATVGGSNWSAPLTLQRGANFIEAVATDAAGNVGYSERAVIAEPSYGISLSLTPTTTAVGGVIQAQAAVTTTDGMSATVIFPFSRNVFAPTNGSATSGVLDLTLTSEHPEVTWRGNVAPGAPVQITWSATATTVISDTAFALANGDGLEARMSNAVEYAIQGGTPPPTTQHIYLPIIIR
jgi:hypothetical protein